MDSRLLTFLLNQKAASGNLLVPVSWWVPVEGGQTLGITLHVTRHSECLTQNPSAEDCPGFSSSDWDLPPLEKMMPAGKW